MSRIIKVSTIQMWDRTEGYIKRGTRTLEKNITEACIMLDEAAKDNPDIVCLPECVTEIGIPIDKRDELKEKIPGPVANRMSQKAREHGMYIVAPIFEDDGESGGFFITGVIFDRQGKIAGKYRKVHEYPPPIEKEYYPVFNLEFGKVGIMICRDNHYPEVARILTLKGAEIIFYPLAGEQLGLNLWQMRTRTRALDNSVYIVASSNEGGSCIIDNYGYVIADSGRKKGVISAKIDLDSKHLCFSDSPMCDPEQAVENRSYDYKQYLLDCRRPETYAKITEVSPDQGKSYRK